MEVNCNNVYIYIYIYIYQFEKIYKFYFITVVLLMHFLNTQDLSQHNLKDFLTKKLKAR
jgi:hypothetical protein